MKKKVNINREKVSSQEIDSRKNFKSVVKSYPSLTNPFRKTSWRFKALLWIIVITAFLVYYESC